MNRLLRTMGVRKVKGTTPSGSDETYRHELIRVSECGNGGYVGKEKMKLERIHC